MNGEKDEDKLASLTKLLDELHLEQLHISNQIQETRKLVHEISNKKQNKETKNIIWNKKIGTVPNIRDEVTVINPKGNQPSRGTVIGYTKTDFVKVQGKDGSIVCRIPKNLRIHKRHE
jgi:hypothetical protein